MKNLYEGKSVEEVVAEKRTTRQSKIFNGAVPTVVEMSKDQCKKLCDKAGKEYLPGYESRVLRYITTNEVQDRYGDIVRATGAILDNYRKNPVVMFSHQHDGFPVGCSLNIAIDKTNKNIPAEALFVDDRVDTSGRADLVYKFAKSGFMPACSIGLMPMESNRPGSTQERMALGLGEYGVEFTKWDYLEFSPCSIPANPDALALAIKSCDLKTFNQEDIDKLARVKFLTDNMLDQFVENIKGNTGKIFSIPSIVIPVMKSAGETEPEPAPAPEPVTKATLDIDQLNQAIGAMNANLQAMNIKIDRIVEGIAELIRKETEPEEPTDSGESEGEAETPDMYMQAMDNILGKSFTQK